MAIEPSSNAPDAHAPPYDPPPKPAAPPSPGGLQIGDKVTFDDAKGRAQVGMITCINRRCATLEAMDGRSCRVDLQLLRRAVEV